MDRYLLQIIERLNIPAVCLIVTLTFFVSILGVIVMMKRSDTLDYKESDTQDSHSSQSLSKIVVVCIVAPYVETLFVQFLLFSFLKFFIGSTSFFYTSYLVMATLVFALMHTLGGTLMDMVTRIPLGLLLALIFLYGIVHEGHPILMTVCVHAVWNFVCVCVLPRLKIFERLM